jgi:hypothetical protein
VKAGGIVLVGVKPADEGALLGLQAAPAGAQEIAVTGAILLQKATGPIGPENMNHPRGIIAVVQIGRIAGPPEFVKHLASMGKGNAPKVPRRDVNIRALAATLAQFSTLRTETKLHFGFHRFFYD